MSAQLEEEARVLRARVEELFKENQTLWARLEIAEPNARENTERCHKLEMLLEATRDERDEARTELKDWLEAHPPSLCSAHRVLDLNCRICNHALHERDTAQAACAEMRSVMSTEWDYEKVQHALSSEAGKGWISPFEFKARVQELQQRLIAVCAQP